MALPKEPRQKMINIMYLVLTAILALNVSSEILNAFKTFDDSFNKSNIALRARSQKLINDFDADQNKNVPAEKIAEWKPRAIKVNELSEDIFQFVDKLKLELQQESGLTADGKFKEDDLEATTRLLVEGKAKSKIKRGEELYKLLEKYKEDLAKIDPSISRKTSNLPLNLNIPKLYNKDDEAIVNKMAAPEKWAYIYFHMTPTIAALAMLSKFQNDIRSSQTQLIEFCYSQINTVELPPNSFGVIASANATIVTPGDAVEITAGLGAYNSESKPNIIIDGANVPIGPDGTAIYKMTASTAGDYTKRVTITYTNPITGKQETKTSDVKFKVVTPTGLSLSTDKTRVVYAGLENPITITGAAGGAGALNVSASGATISPGSTGPGSYIVKPSVVGSVTINVSDGKSSRSFNIPSREVPEPKAGLGLEGSSLRTYGTIPANDLVSPGKISAELANFFLDAKFEITSFNVSFDDGTVMRNSGSILNGEIKNKIRASESGDRILIYGINYRSPSGQIKSLSQGLSFDIN
jgi:gliding motility-associated protein GldM